MGRSDRQTSNDGERDPLKKKENGDDGTFCWHWPSLSNHTKMHHPVTVIKFHNYIKSAFNLSNVLAWSINLYLFVVWIKTWYALLQV